MRRRCYRLVRFLFKSRIVFALYDCLKDVLEAAECLVDDFVSVCHRGIKTAACQSDDSVCHIRRAHLFHSNFSSEHFGFLFEHRNYRAEQAHIREVVTHCARAFEVDDAALIVDDVRKIVFLHESFKAGCKTVARFACNFASVVLFDFADCEVSGIGTERVCSESAADVRFLTHTCKTCSHKGNVFFLAAYAACGRIAARNDFAEYREVGIHISARALTFEFDDFAAFEFLVVDNPRLAVDGDGGVVHFVAVLFVEEVTCRAVNADSETGDDFVEDKERAVFFARSLALRL